MSEACVLTVNLASVAIPDPHKPQNPSGIDKRPVERIEVFAPGPRDGVNGSGVRGDFIGDLRHHGGDDQAVYAVPREDLDAAEEILGRRLDNGWMGENLTITGLDANQSVVGERWRIGEAELQVSSPRIPCGTFEGWAGRRGWMKEAMRVGRLGTYLRVLRGGVIEPGMAIEVFDVPAHGVTVQEFLWAATIKPDLVAKVFTARDYLPVADAERFARRLA